MPYIIEAWEEGDIWCARTPDKDTFRHIDLAHAVGEIFTNVTAAAQHVPSSLMNASPEETGEFMIEHAAKYGVSITYPDLERRKLDPKTNPSHPLNLYESLVTGTWGGR